MQRGVWGKDIRTHYQKEIDIEIAKLIVKGESGYNAALKAKAVMLNRGKKEDFSKVRG